MMSNNQDLKQVLNDLKIEFDIKGGGSSQMIQGQFSGDAEALIRKFSKKKIYKGDFYGKVSNT